MTLLKNFQQLFLVFAGGFLISYGILSLLKSFFITKTRDANFWLGVTLVTGTTYILAQIGLTWPASPSTHLLIHRIKMFALIISVTGWVHTLYLISFPESRYSRKFALMAFLVICLVPFDFFLDLPIKNIHNTILGVEFSQYFATTQPGYLVMVTLIIIPFSLIPINKFLFTRGLSIRKRLLGCLVFTPGMIGGLNDFAVTNGIYSGIMIAEYVFLFFLVGVSIHLFREDASNHRLLKSLAVELECKVKERTAELEQANQKLQKMAATDLLTGLFNRREFTVILSQEEARVKRYQGEKLGVFSLLFIDLDNFKYINDTFGHAVGDLVLNEFAQQLKSLLRVPDTLARYGGDEFVALLPNTKRDGALELANRIISELKKSENFCAIIKAQFGSECAIPDESRLGCSIGVATYKDGNFKSSEECLIAADQALYAAKQAGKNRALSWLEVEKPG